MKASALLKHNIDTLLKARGQNRRELAIWCRQSTDKKVDAWISHIFTRADREFQLKYLDRIADFFGIAVYQLFQPGISPLTERRTGEERRVKPDRRISGRPAGLPVSPVRQLSVTPEDEALLAELHALKYEQYQHVRGWINAARFGRSTARDTTPPPDPPQTSGRRRGTRKTPRGRPPREDGPEE